MFRIRFLAGLLTVALAMGCKAQSTPPQSTPPVSPEQVLNRHIEALIRSKYGVPQNVSLTLGARGSSQVSGYDTLPVTLTQNDHKSVINFLLSTDSKTLARLEVFSLEHDPIFSIDVSGRSIRGNPAAKVTVINFDDLECPYCARMHEMLFPSTLEHYGDKVRFIYKDDPLLEIHPWALHAAVDANCLSAQNGQAYWSYVDYLHAHGQEIDGEDRSDAKSFEALDRIARQEGTMAKVDASLLDACLRKQDETSVRASISEADALRIEGTPALFIDGERIDGARPMEQIWTVIDRALRAAGEQPPSATEQPVAAQPVKAPQAAMGK